MQPRRMVRPGGRLAITTWGPNLFEPANGAFWEAIRHERPELYRGFNPWDRISEPDGLREMLRAAGVIEAEIVAEIGDHPLNDPADWWTLAMGSGYRGPLAQLDAGAMARVHEKNVARLREIGAKRIETNVVYAIATKNAAIARVEG